VSRARDELIARRAVLLARAAAEREEIAGIIERLSRPIALADRGLALVGKWKRGAPLAGAALGVAFAALAVVRPRSVATWAVSAVAAWRVTQAMRGITSRASGGANPRASAPVRPAAETEAIP
jgi:hypothetical protein